MALARPLIVTALCALSLPATALSQTAQPQTDTNAQAAATNANRDCDQACAQRAQAEARARAERRRAARARLAPFTTMHVNSRINRDVAENCRYSSDVHGSYRARDAATPQSAALRDVDVHASAELTCGGQVVRRATQRFVFPHTTRGELANLMHTRLTTPVPGSECSWGATYRFDGGNLRAQAVSGNCERSASVAAVSGYGQPGVRAGAASVATAQGQSVTSDRVKPDVGESARGGGPGDDPTSFDARAGVH